MAGKRITDLPLVPLLYPIDYIPVARDNQTLRIAGSAVVASHIYEPHRKVNEFTSRKYQYLEDNTLTITPEMNNTAVAIPNNVVTITISTTGAFKLGLQVDLFSISEYAVEVKIPLQFSYSYITADGEITENARGVFKGYGSSINPYEMLKLVHIAPGVWIRIPQGGNTQALQLPPETYAVEEPRVGEMEAPVIIDTTGNKLDLIAIDGRSIVSIGDSSTTFVSIQGSAAYS